MNVQEQEQAQADAAFAQGFSSVSGIEVPLPTAASSDAVAGSDNPDDSTPAATDAAEATPAASENAEAPAAQEGAQAPAAAPAADDDDPVVLDGLKRSELHRLLSNAADVDGLRKQLDKAHGSIGDLNRRLQQAQAATPAAAPVPAVAPELPAELKQFEQDYPDVAAYVKALGSAPQQRQVAPPAEAPQSVATESEQPAQAGPDPMAIEVAVMDRMHKGWREKVHSQDFNLWLASQGQEVQQKVDSAVTADALSEVIGTYDQWATARTAAADKSAKGQQRLKAAVTPTGNAPRPQAAPTENDAMEAAFKRTLGL